MARSPASNVASAPQTSAQGWKRLRNNGLRRVLRGGQRLGVNVLPHHYYSSVPDLRSLESTEQWRSARPMVGVRGTDLDEQVAFLNSCFTPGIRAALAETNVYARACQENGAVGYGPVEARLLFAFIAAQQPSKVVQVGAGVSTSIVLQARREFGLDVDVTCIDPYPTDYLRKLATKGEITLIDRPAQEVPASTYGELPAGGLLFVDSTHTVKPGSEVNYLVLDVLPQLGDGVFAHFHDISFPYDYPLDLLDENVFFWTESTLLHAFLIGNARARIAMSASMLHHGRPDAVRSHLPDYRPQPMHDGLRAADHGDYPSATYLEINSG